MRLFITLFFLVLTFSLSGSDDDQAAPPSSSMPSVDYHDFKPYHNIYRGYIDKNFYKLILEYLGQPEEIKKYDFYEIFLRTTPDGIIGAFSDDVEPFQVSVNAWLLNQLLGQVTILKKTDDLMILQAKSWIFQFLDPSLESQCSLSLIRKTDFYSFYNKKQKDLYVHPKNIKFFQSLDDWSFPKVDKTLSIPSLLIKQTTGIVLDTVKDTGKKVWGFFFGGDKKS